MKKLKLLLPALLLHFLAYSQAGQINQINIVNFTVKNTLPGIVDSWMSTPGALVLTAQKVPGTQIREPMMVLQIRSGSAVICGNTTATPKRVDPFDVRVFTTADLLGLLSNCNELKAGNYSICVQFFNIDKVAISREVCKDFRVEETNIEYAPPTLITPENEKKFSQNELQGLVMFRWTPLVPKPKEPVTYRLKVWQLMQGQNGNQAMRTNQPIVTKDVENLTQATVTGIITGPCKPPYLCDFIWNVQALNRSGKPMGNNNGLSEPYRFGATEEKSKGPDNVFPEDKKAFKPDEVKQSVTFRWTALVPKPKEPVTYRLKVWQLMQGQNGTQAMRSNTPIATKDVTDITEVTVSNIYTGPCRPPYLCDFIWNVQVVTRDGTPGAESEPTVFSIKEESAKCPVNTLPRDKKEIRPTNAKQGITFKWTTTAGQTATYRLKVWQLMQGQNGAQAMKSNNPIVTKEVRNVNEVTINSIYTGPCRPPYLCDFIWAVEMMDATGRVSCTSEPTTFKIANNDIDIQIDSLNIECCKNGKQNFTLILRNNLATPVKITQIKIDKVNGVTANIIPSPLAPALPVNIPGNGTQIFSGQINCLDTAKIIRFWVAAEDPVDNAITETEVEADTLNCRCDACDEKNFVMNTPAPGQVTVSNNSISFNQSITVTTTPPKTIKSIKAELVYFEMIPENDQCIPCDKDAGLYGHFLGGTNSQQWNGPQTSLGINISIPNTPCCATLFRWCIRYKIEFTDCTVCSKVICYEKKKAGCIPTGGGGTGTGTGTGNPIRNNPK